MKYIIIAVAILCGSAQAAIPSVPSDKATCALAGSIAGAAAMLQREGFSREHSVKSIESAIKAGATKKGAPPWTRMVVEVSWDATAQVPAFNPDWAEDMMTARCMEK